MMFTKKNVLYSMLAFIVLLILSSCVSSSGVSTIRLGEKKKYEIAFETGDYNSGIKEIKNIIQASTSEEKPKLQKRFSKILFTYAWKELKNNAIDDSFKLAFAGKEYATDEFLSSKPFLSSEPTYGEKYNEISHKFAQYHFVRARLALKSPNLKLALDEFQIGSNAINNTDQQAQKEFIKWSKERNDLKSILNQANEAINQEDWAKSNALIDQVRQNDISLQPECDELLSLLHLRQYLSITRDAQALLEKNMFIPAFNKANEATSLSTNLLEAKNLKIRIQDKFALYVKKDIDEALINDKRYQLIPIAKQFEQLEMLEPMATLEKIVQDRNEADRQLEIARVKISSGQHEQAISYLEKASDLWSENTNIKGLYRKTCLHVSNSALKKAKKFIHQNYPMLGLLYCLKAQTICPQEQVIISQSGILINQASGLADQMSIDFKVFVDINLDQNVNAIIDTQKLQEVIASAIPQESRFVRVISLSENIPTNNKIFTVSVDIKDFTIKTVKTMFNKNIRYVSYVANDPNPNYMELQAKLAAAEYKMNAANNNYQQAMAMKNQAVRRASAARRSGGLGNLLNAVSGGIGYFGVAKAQEDYSAANSEYENVANSMSNTSPTTPRNVYSDYQYVVEEYRRTGLLNAIVKFINPEKQILMQEQITKSYNKSDQKHAGFSPAGLSRDPLVLNTENEINEYFTQQIFSDAPDAASSFVSEYWDDILKDIEREPKKFTRWERRLILALQVPSLKEPALDEIIKAENHLPSDLIDKIDSFLKID